MIALKEWAKLGEVDQVKWWAGVPADQRILFLEVAAPVTRIILQTPLKGDGDHTSNRAAIVIALRQAGYALKDDRWNRRYSEVMTWLPRAAQRWRQGLEGAVRDHWPAARFVSARANAGRLKNTVACRWRPNHKPEHDGAES